jgi:Polyketide cyclase / dehydrase and lipid transport
MAAAKRTRTVHAPLEQVWEVIADPHHMPRWWPGVTRMEDVGTDHWTHVFTTKKGRPVRVDYHLLQSDPPGPGGDPPGVRAWEQEIAGTPFERVLAESITEIVLVPADAGTEVTISQRQKLRGYSRTGGFLLRRATKEKLTEALDGLEGILTPR